MNGAFLTHTELDGPSPATDWYPWVQTGRSPAVDLASGDWLRGGWTDDLRALRELGFSRLGVGLEWAVLEPTMGQHDDGAVEQFLALLDGAAELEFELTACLVDSTLPGWFSIDQRGFLDDRSRSLVWPRHVEWIGETFGHRVATWLPLREPVHHAVRSNLLAMAPPGRSDPEATGKAVKAMLLAEGEAWRVLRGSAPVASHQTARLFLPTADDVEAERHARDLDQLHHASWAGALARGVLELPGLPPVSAPMLRDAFELIVLQLRPAVTIDAAGSWSPTDLGFLTEGLATALHEQVESITGRELHVAVDLAPVGDDEQKQFDHLQALMSEAADGGASGWWQTSPIDGWHWHLGHARPGVLTAEREARRAADLFAS